jgi:hypothetical protein
MAAISFKSVGDLNSNVRSVQERQPVPIGIVTPVVTSRRVGGPFEMSTLPILQVIDNFRNMLLTNHGERLPFYDFGGNLRSLLTERVASIEYDERAILLIKDTTEKYMPYISLDTFESQVLNTDKNAISKIKILVKFSIPRLSNTSKQIEIILTNIG